MAIYNQYVCSVVNTITLLCMHARVGYSHNYIFACWWVFSRKALICISADCISYLFDETDTVVLACKQLTFNFEGKLAIAALLIYISCICGHMLPCSVVPEQCMYAAN